MGEMDTQRNHLRLVQGPLDRFLNGANNDTEILLNKNSGKSTLNLLGIEGHEFFCINLNVAGMGCLESGRGSDILEEYFTKYSCKDGKSSASHETDGNVLTEHYCKNDDNS